MESPFIALETAPPFVRLVLNEIHLLPRYYFVDLAHKEFDSMRIEVLTLLLKYAKPTYESAKFHLQIAGFTDQNLSEHEGQVFRNVNDFGKNEDGLRVICGRILQVAGEIRKMNQHEDVIDGFQKIMDVANKEKHFLDGINDWKEKSGERIISLSELHASVTEQFLESTAFNPHPHSSSSLIDLGCYIIDCVSSNGIAAIHLFQKRITHPYLKRLFSFVIRSPKPSELLCLLKVHQKKADLALQRNEIDQSEFQIVLICTLLIETVYLSLDPEVFKSRVSLTLESIDGLLDGFDDSQKRADS